jgi:hypothetical protein
MGSSPHSLAARHASAKWSLYAVRPGPDRWQTFGLVGDRWQRVLKEERGRHLLNAYRMLLTRAPGLS